MKDKAKQKENKEEDSVEQNLVEEKENLEPANNDKKEPECDCEELEKTVSECEEKYKRALADYHNVVKRTTIERADWIRSANKDLLLRLLPILDTIQMLKKHSSEQGIDILEKQFFDILKSEGVIRIETESEKFDPSTMECIQTKEGEDGKVIEELRTGFMQGDKVLRPAQVTVGKK